MKVECALLCDAVTVREGLLHILGGAVTRLNRTEYPGPMGVALALLFVVHPTEADRPHTAEIIVLSDDGGRLVEMQMRFQLESDIGAAPGEELPVPLQVPLHGVPLPMAGSYSIEVLIDGVHHKSVPFRAELIPGGQQ